MMREHINVKLRTMLEARRRWTPGQPSYKAEQQLKSALNELIHDPSGWNDESLQRILLQYGFNSTAFPFNVGMAGFIDEAPWHNELWRLRNGQSLFILFLYEHRYELISSFNNEVTAYTGPLRGQLKNLGESLITKNDDPFADKWKKAFEQHFKSANLHSWEQARDAFDQLTSQLGMQEYARALGQHNGVIDAVRNRHGKYCALLIRWVDHDTKKPVQYTTLLANTMPHTGTTYGVDYDRERSYVVQP